MRRAGLAAGITAAVAAAFLVPAGAATTVSGGDPGSNPAVVRGGTTTITEDLGAQFYFRSSSTAAYAAQTGQAIQIALGFGLSSFLCLGDNTASGGKNNSPRDTITVTDPNHQVIATQVSPVRSLSAVSQNAPPANPQPAPNNTNYRGDTPASAGTSHGFSFPLGLTGRPAGIYTVTTVSQSMAKTSAGACTVGHPDPANAKLLIPSAVTTTTTFEYRPWQDTFTDVLGAGSVSANVTPTEFQFSIGSQTSAIYPGSQGGVKFYTFPNSLTLMLPPDPVACAANPASCLPSVAQPCDPSTGCQPRIMTINKTSGNERLQGFFDLTTKAFVAAADINGTERFLLSLGTTNDGYLHDLLAKLAAGAAAQGIDLESLLATKVRLANGSNELTLSLLNGLQIAPSTAKGLQIVSDATVQAGIIVGLYIANPTTTCTTQSASSSTDPGRFTPTSGVGYSVQRSDILPSVPSVGALGAIVGGPIYHITGNFPANVAAENDSSAVVGVDTAADEPNGYPVWVAPVLDSGHLASPRTMDYLGTATWSASETSLGSSCLVIDFMLGTGVALYNNPLPVGFGTLLDPLYKPSPAAATLTNEINTAVQTVVNTVTTNPTISGLLTQLTGALPLP